MNRHGKRLQRILAVNVVLLLAAFGLIIYFLCTRIRRNITIEAGQEVTVDLFQRYSWDSADFQLVEYPEETNRLGTYKVKIEISIFQYSATITTVDTTPPKAKTKTVTGWLNKPKKATDFIESVEDLSRVEAAFVTRPDWSLEGEQTVYLLLTDASGNEAVYEAKLVLMRDTEKPTIEVDDIDVEVGGTVSYRKAVRYSDNIDTPEEMTLTIDRDNVDLNRAGSYTVIYTVTDCSGNSASAEGKVNVIGAEPAVGEEDILHAKADEILASILTDAMTDQEKAKAIYQWIKSHIVYTSYSEKGDYRRGAYEGMFQGKGDCFVYAATARELLTRAGISNMDIVKSTDNPSHYWNLIDVGNGWQHFDSTPREGNPDLFLISDADLKAYSISHGNSHIYDRSLYPEIQ